MVSCPAAGVRRGHTRDCSLRAYDDATLLVTDSLDARAGTMLAVARRCRRPRERTLAQSGVRSAMRRVVVLSAFVLVSMFAALAPPGMPTEAQANCFSQTGFCITNS